MLRRGLQRSAVIGVMVCLQACAGDVRLMLADLERHESAVELIDTPFFAQITDQCGPSALAAVLGASGISVRPEVLRERIYIPGRGGSLQVELLAATRSYRRMPYLIDQDSSRLLAELGEGRPVLILQNLGVAFAPVWHYAVVVGFLPDSRQFVLRSGDQQRQRMDAARFLRSWRRAGYWGFVALKPGELPSSPDAGRYVRAVADLESTGYIAEAMAGYRAAITRWPDYPLAWLGLGNASYAQGELKSAETAYRKLIALNPNDAVALNNLAQVQADRGCYADASTTLDTALSMAGDDPVIRGIIEESRQQLSSGASSKTCL